MADQRRAWSTGSAYYDTQKGRWVVSVEAGFSTTGGRKRSRRMTDPADGKPIRDERHAAKVLRDLLREDVTETRSATTVKSWADTWLPMRADEVDPSSYATDSSTVRRWIVPTIGRKRIDQLTPGDIRSVIKAMQAAGRAHSSVVRCRSVLILMLKAARAEGHAVPDRLLEIRIRKADDPVRRPAIPLADALRVLIAARPEGLDDGSDSRWLAALLAGVRPAEARGLTWDCVNLDAATLDVSWQLKSLPYKIARNRSSGFRVPDGYTARHLVGSYHLVRPKTGAGRRTVPMPPILVDALTRWRELGTGSMYGLVWPRAATEWFPGRAGWPMLDSEDREAWKRLCERAGVPAYDLYSARHTMATQLTEAGIDDATITAIMGHTSIRSTTPYQHPDRAAAMREAVGQIAQAFEIEG